MHTFYLYKWIYQYSRHKYFFIYVWVQEHLLIMKIHSFLYLNNTYPVSLRKFIQYALVLIISSLLSSSVGSYLNRYLGIFQCLFTSQEYAVLILCFSAIDCISWAKTLSLVTWFPNLPSYTFPMIYKAQNKYLLFIK